jgi:hypothetical protein
MVIHSFGSDEATAGQVGLTIGLSERNSSFGKGKAKKDGFVVFQEDFNGEQATLFPVSDERLFDEPSLRRRGRERPGIRDTRWSSQSRTPVTKSLFRRIRKPASVGGRNQRERFAGAGIMGRIDYWGKEFSPFNSVVQLLLGCLGDVAGAKHFLGGVA